jgi:hypothetical protein
MRFQMVEFLAVILAAVVVALTVALALKRRRHPDEAILQVYADTMEQLSRATQAYEDARHGGDGDAVVVLDRVLAVLQGRIEGVGLVYYVFHGERDDADSALLGAYQARGEGRR